MAEEYRSSAKALVKLGRFGGSITGAPFRLAAIHAIELYLNVWLLLDGIEPSVIRGLHHDFAKRTELVLKSDLRLRLKTVQHLIALSERREYIVARYAPEQLMTLTQPNRLQATLEEVARKVKQRATAGAKTAAA
ncbi:hypothetical protein [Fulvimarina sp. MAC8]|uniref:hypothetical protein n=1 Tax=Fulvimarina sp. MAC8 TaxID=3162874 RepID=UPI0032ECDFDE